MLAPEAKRRRSSQCNASVLSNETNKASKPPLFKNIAKMAMGRRRKRALDSADDYEQLEESDDKLDETVTSLDASSVSKRSRMAKMTSFVSTPVAKVGHALHRSVSGARLASPSPRRPTRATTTPSSSPSKPFWRSVSHAVMNSPSKVISNDHSWRESGGKENGGSSFKRGVVNRSSNTKLTPYKMPGPTPQKERPTRFWSSEYPETAASLNRKQINLQEAIFEVMCGEENLVGDLVLMRKIYAESMLHLNILTQQEVDDLFARLFDLIPVHEFLNDSLKSLQDASSGLFDHCGQTLLHFVEKLNGPYVHYCSNLISSQLFLEHRRESDKDLGDFLHRCIDSPFSRKLDLAAHLDCPRAKLAKYPLLVRQILKYVDDDLLEERSLLESSLCILNTTLSSVDKEMARAKCRLTLSRLEWLDEDERSDTVNDAKEAILEGVLRNSRGTKLECHLLDTVLILCRPSSRGLNKGAVKRLQVYRTPIPVSQLVVDDLGADVTTSSSVKSVDSDTVSIASSKQSNLSGSSHSGKGKPAFRVSFRCGDESNQLEESTATMSASKKRKQSAHTLIASDEHSKKLWISTIRKLTSQSCQDRPDYDVQSAASVDNGDIGRRKRRLSSLSSMSSTSSSSSNISLSNTKAAFKKRGSPRLKAALNESHSFSHLQRGGVVRRIRNIASTSAINDSKQAMAALPPRPYKIKQSQSATKKRSKPSTQKRPLLKQRTKSLEVLNDEAIDIISSSLPRYMTRSQTKLSKSLSDLAADHKH